MANKILAFVEQRNNEIKKTSLEAVKAAAELGAQLGAETEAVVIGGDINDFNAIAGYGIPKVTHIKNPDLNLYTTSGYTQALTDYINESGADVIFFANTAMARDLAPHVAVKLDAGTAMDCVALNVDGGELIATRPVYAGKALIDVKVNGDKKIYTIRPNTFTLGEANDANAEVNVKEVGDVDLSVKVTELKQSSGKLDVAEASIIVSGGRGMGGPENYAMLEELAELLGGAVGASRAAVDAGWRPHSDQVGQTGKTVSPNLYIAVGISGAIQHLAGMRTSKYIVAINKDPEAPIFQVADYGITGDLFEVVPALIEEVKKVKNA